MVKKSLVAFAVLATLSGCKTTVTNVCPSSTRVELPMSAHPMKGTAGSKVVLFMPKVQFNTFESERTAAAIYQNLNQHITQAGAEVIDRKLTQKLKSELQIAEASGRYNDKGIAVADMAISTDIGVVNFKRDFTEARSWTKDGKHYSTPASCSFKAEVKATTKVVSLPSLQTVKVINFKDSYSTSTETRNSSCPISQQEKGSIIARAAEYAINANADLKNLLSPKGSVIEMRQCKSGTMVKIGIGTKHGVNPDQDVKFTTYEKVDNGNGNFEVESYGNGEGEVINNPEHGIKSSYSWVLVDKETASKIKKGDTGQVEHEECGLLCQKGGELTEGLSDLIKF
ncbi:MAG: hypothetical protein ACPGUD_11070 [Parashewanella sp.]